MKCRYCGSNRIYRSHRQGLKEGLWLRFVHMAPYRCHDCGARYMSREHHHAGASHRGRDQSLAEYVGLRGREYKVRQWLITIAMTLIFLAVSIIFLLRAIDI
jgi:DNA-directed RNA polymerase subunit RPC12/RpoP